MTEIPIDKHGKGEINKWSKRLYSNNKVQKKNLNFHARNANRK